MKYLMMVCLLIPAMATADEQRIGFVAGSTHGVGLGYSKQFKDGRGWQVSALPIVEDDLDATVFLGATMFQTLNSNTWGRAYWSLGIATFYTRQSREEWDTEGPLLDEGVMFSFGPGVGLERRWKQFAISLELPLAVQAGYHNHEFKFLGMHPIPNFSLMYFW